MSDQDPDYEALGRVAATAYWEVDIAPTDEEWVRWNDDWKTVARAVIAAYLDQRRALGYREILVGSVTPSLAGLSNDEIDSMDAYLRAKWGLPPSQDDDP